MALKINKKTGNCYKLMVFLSNLNCQSILPGEARITIKKHPNLLIVSEAPIDSKNGFGVTLSNLLGDWPSDSMRCFYTYSEFKSEYGAKKGFVYAHVPNSPGRSFCHTFLPWIQT